MKKLVKKKHKVCGISGTKRCPFTYDRHSNVLILGKWMSQQCDCALH
jgi:hypothetical protein